MKQLLAIAIASACGFSSAWAGFSEKRMEMTMRSAERTGKLVAFVFYEDSTQYREPRDVDAAVVRNAAVKQAIPRSDVVLVEIVKGDKDTDKIPKCVSREGKTPRAVITDAKGEKVILEFQGAPNRDKEKEIKDKIEKATAKPSEE
jgi:hypothetical protein